MTQSTSTEILGVPFKQSDLKGAYEECDKALAAGKGGAVFFVNTHSLSLASERRDLQCAFRLARFCFADGMPIVWYARAMGLGLPERVCGPDFMAGYVAWHRDSVHGFIGGDPKYTKTLIKNLGVRGVAYSPPFRPFSVANALEDWESFLRENDACGFSSPPQIVWVGLGAPKQELWISAVSSRAPGSLFFGVGAAFDFYSGASRRAPKVVQKLGSEWLHRLVQDPSRLLARYTKYNWKFLKLVIQDVIGQVRNESTTRS